MIRSVLTGALLGAANLGLAKAGLVAVDQSGQFYGDGLAAVAATSLMLLGALSGVALHLGSSRMRSAVVSLVVALSLWVAGALWMRSSVSPAAFELVGGPYGVVAIVLGLLVWTIAAVSLASAAHLLRPGGGPWGWSLALARRFLTSKRREATVSVITLISVVGVAMGVSAMIVVMSVMSGFASDLKSKILGANPHLIVFRYGHDFTDYEPLSEQLKTVEGVESVVPFLYSEVMVTSPSNLSGAVLRGVRPNDLPVMGKLTESLRSGDLGFLDKPEAIPDPMDRYRKMLADLRAEEEGVDATPDAGPAEVNAADDDFLDVDEPTAQPGEKVGAASPGIVIGSEMAKALHAEIGTVVQVVNPLGELGPTGPIPKARSFKVAAVFHTGFYEYDAKFAYVALEEAQSFLDAPGRITGLELRVDEVEQVAQIRKQVMSQLFDGAYYTRDWMDANRPLFQALRLEKIVMFLILCAVVLVASLNIITALVMVVLERGKEIAILKSVGATDRGIMRVFVSYGVAVGLSGTLAGSALGLGVCGLIKVFGVNLDATVYYIDRLPVELRMGEVGVVVIAALVLCFLAALYPAWHASRLRPVEGIRYD
ncbi:MAG: FtsX-like permease family protein [Myxococcota bacterium]|nr:FtsX-like permease family protein [Myxococcota bacterium]